MHIYIYIYQLTNIYIYIYIYIYQLINIYSKASPYNYNEPVIVKRVI